ncbi:MAG: dihydrolipoyl dehydrogenase [Desulfuromonadaceae bacterium]|nr:dihydrolipoyl dehydrogenase [Desulfuromonadaceae bacterium]
MTSTWDTVVLGGGPAGFMAALHLQMAGKKVCLVEAGSARLGGVCLHEGCMPTKSLLKTAEIYAQLRQAEEYGLQAKVEPVDLQQAVARKNTHLQSLNNQIQQMFEQSGVHVQVGHGAFISPAEIEVVHGNERIRLKAQSFIIATGSRPRDVRGLSVDGDLVLNSTQMLNNTRMPQRLLVVGGGAIGCEFASMYQAFGAHVTLLESAPQLLPREDADTAAALQQGLEKRGVHVLTGSSATIVELKPNSVEVEICGGTNEHQFFDQVLIAVGRQPNTEGLQLQHAGVVMSGPFIQVDKHLRTSQPHIYAAGDVVDTMMLAHTAEQESGVVVANLLGKNEELRNHAIPRVVYSFPQVAAVGALENDLPAGSFTVLQQPFAENGKALVDQRQEGHVKILVDKQTQRLLGAAIVGDHATELIHELTLAVTLGLPLQALQQTVHAHPTLAETIWKLAKSVA